MDQDDPTISDMPTMEDASTKEGDRLKVTVLSGFLGAGKTTLLKRILRTNEKGKQLRMAVIVNDMGEVNLDADEIKSVRLVKEEAEMVELHNGCICCTLRGDLLKTVKSLAEEKKFDYLVIESTGISEPLPVAQTFVMDVDGNGENADDGGDENVSPPSAPTKTSSSLTVAESIQNSLSHYAELDTMVTVVDALNIFDVLSSIEKLSEKNVSGMVGNTGTTEEGKENEEDEDDRSLCQLMLDQIEFANVIVVSKAHLLLERSDEDTLAEIVTLLKKLNPNARVVVPRGDKYADLNVEKELIGTGLFDMDEAIGSAGWLAELEKDEHTPETEEYGISSFVFRNRNMPFHPQRLFDILNGFGSYTSALNASRKAVGQSTDEDKMDIEEGEQGEKVFKGVVRSKGHLWLANANAFPMDMHTAGKCLAIEPVGKPWLAAENESEWDEDDREEHDELVREGSWSDTYGDRHNEIVFIGIGLDKKLIADKLNAALLTEAESKALGGMEGWRKLEDPFFGGVAAENWFEVSYMEDEDDEENVTTAVEKKVETEESMETA